MKLGITLRSMGPESTADLLSRCTRSAELAGLDDVWIQDHIAIPPEDAEGSGGRYLDPLTTLAFLAAQTTRIGLGVGVLNLPYRAPLPTAKALATVQELSGGRVQLGVGVGWMKAEFEALGVPRTHRGRLANEALAFIRRCFDADEMQANGQDFLFLPRPKRPPIFIGGAAPHALERTVRFGDGWLPMMGDPEKLREPINQLHRLADEAGRSRPEVKAMTALPLNEPEQAVAKLGALVDVGITSLVQGVRYQTLDEFEEVAGRLAACRSAL